METKFNFSLTKPQVVEVFKKQARKATKAMMIMAIVLLCLTVLLASMYYFVELTDLLFGLVMLFGFLDLCLWFIFVIIRRSAPKNAENYYKYYAVSDVVEFCYELTDTEFVVSQPAIGNVSHYKYSMVTRVVDLGGYVAVMLTANQYLPVPATDQTAPLISTLKSLAQVKK